MGEKDVTKILSVIAGLIVKDFPVVIIYIMFILLCNMFILFVYIYGRRLVTVFHHTHFNFLFLV